MSVGVGSDPGNSVASRGIFHNFFAVFHLYAYADYDVGGLKRITDIVQRKD